MPYPITQFKNRLRFVAVCCLLLFLSLSTACSHPGGSLPLPAGNVRPDADFNRLFTRHGGGWTGGDGTLSIPLPDGRSLWLFGDTFLGRVRSDGTRSVESPLIRNSLVVQDGRKLTTHYGGTRAAPEAFLVPQEPDAWYWPGDGTVQKNRLQIFFHRFRQMAPGMWGWAWDGTVIATVRLPRLILERVTRRDDADGIAYGASLLETGPWIYIFGTRQIGAIKHLHLARAARGGLEGQWDYWDGQRWSPKAAASRAILSGVSSQFGVVPVKKGIALVTVDGRQPFTGRIVAYWAEDPIGPWRGPVDIYQAPEANDQVAAYNPFVHSQFCSRDGVLISYNINHLHDPDRLYQDAALYRPRFIRVDLDGLTDRIRNKHP